MNEEPKLGCSIVLFVIGLYAGYSIIDFVLNVMAAAW